MKGLYIAILLVGTAFIQVKAQPKHVDSKTFYDQMQVEEGILLDVRTLQEYSRGHIEGSTLISVNDQRFMEKVKLLQKEKPIYVYCLTGSRSFAVANYLDQMGYSKIYNLQRGIMEWNQLGYPIVQNQIVEASESKTYNSDEFNALVTSNSLLLINFHAPWCAPCKKMAPTIEQIKTDFSGKAKIEKVDVEANQALQTSHKVQSVPGLVLFKSGKEIWRHTGILNYDELSKILNQHL